MIEYHTKSIQQSEFYSALRRIEQLSNCGATATYQHARGETFWAVAGQIIGISRGMLGSASDYYLVTKVVLSDRGNELQSIETLVSHIIDAHQEG